MPHNDETIGCTCQGMLNGEIGPTYTEGWHIGRGSIVAETEGVSKNSFV